MSCDWDSDFSKWARDFCLGGVRRDLGVNQAVSADVWSGPFLGGRCCDEMVLSVSSIYDRI